ncbi:helicase, putative [Jonesia denitrificans DSM 20603]|uniref:Helicase, putative n=1 Tax=Jonesia denitrificans (strain ATCC 14870 / DSM 20603 / BCRC 15368 / CIP 55.134 / JCM 11481 / NBRC 15587 / NCTC 10816 / Prevot 55134) TaxID=471856 RepID=C7R3B9_JONDD|nr:helicase, putative [Jonesia denitrificans DSM 20603]ASE07730.1 helicase [Jonesia denitrificans]SQH20643.1 exonuclease V subunit alpha [Jonesia denitrificans]
MATVIEEIAAIDEVISNNIAELSMNRGLLSQNALAQARNLVDQVSLLAFTGDKTTDSNWGGLHKAKKYVAGRGDLKFLHKFYGHLDISASHYTVDGDGAERLMLKYYEYLLRIKQYLWSAHQIEIFHNLSDFPLDLDPALTEYHQKIAERVLEDKLNPRLPSRSSNFYIHKIVPIFVGGRIMYEVTFTPAVGWSSKFDRLIAFTDLEILDNHAVDLELVDHEIGVLKQKMPIRVIRAWSVSVRPCEFENLGRLFGDMERIRRSKDYRVLMSYMTRYHYCLLDIIDLSDHDFAELMDRMTEASSTSRIRDLLVQVRTYCRRKEVGTNVIRYLLFRARNEWIKRQKTSWGEEGLGDTRIRRKSYSFEKMPFYASLAEHNPPLADVFASVGFQGREHEMLARRIRSNVEQRASLYTPIAELASFGDVERLSRLYNARLPNSHPGRTLILDKGHVCIQEYEETSARILNRLDELSCSGVQGYTASVDAWLDSGVYPIGDEVKRSAIRELFSQSKVALIYGAAGTGKSTMIKHVSEYFADSNKLYLAQTHPAVDNLRHRVGVGTNREFRTIASHKNQGGSCDILFIDECSTVSNEDLIKVLEKTSFDLLVLVGDVYQIRSIKFGNWFSLARQVIPPTSIFELTKPFRTTDKNLLMFWDAVRHREDNIEEFMARSRYSTKLNESIFERGDESSDEIILCLNYDGLYGINNINGFLQSTNQNPPVVWGQQTYKVGDPVLFNELSLYRPLIYNNLKGVLAGIEDYGSHIDFTVRLLGKIFTEEEAEESGLEFIDSQTVKLTVLHRANNDEDDTDEHKTSVVPFQVAYAVSIHKAQGLEYDYVRLVITDSNEDQITHNIFYTAITRSKSRLKIYWSAEAQRRIIDSFQEQPKNKDLGLLKARQKI